MTVTPTLAAVAIKALLHAVPAAQWPGRLTLADDDDEKPPHQHTAACSTTGTTLSWEGLDCQRFWTPWAQDALEPPTQTIRFQQTMKGRPLKRDAV